MNLAESKQSQMQNNLLVEQSASRGPLSERSCNINQSLFSMVEIEINSRCNRKCSYCPNSEAPRSAPKFMTRPTFQSIVARLQEVEFAGRLSYHFYGEPLLHPQLDEFVELVSKMLPNARQVLYSNGDFLNFERYERLLQFGIDYFVITSHDGIKRAEWPHMTALIPGDLELTNRGGLVSVGPAAPRLPCFAPATMLIVTITGNVVLCYEDARESVVMGNVLTTPLRDIWFSEHFAKLRERLAMGDRRATKICEKCNNRAHQSEDQFDFVL